MIDRITDLFQRGSFYQTRTQYLEELEFSQALEEYLYDPADESVEYSSAILEAAIFGKPVEKAKKGTKRSRKSKSN